jgi:hypothetical protein
MRARLARRRRSRWCARGASARKAGTCDVEPVGRCVAAEASGGVDLLMSPAVFVVSSLRHCECNRYCESYYVYVDVTVMC